MGKLCQVFFVQGFYSMCIYFCMAHQNKGYPSPRPVSYVGPTLCILCSGYFFLCSGSVYLCLLVILGENMHLVLPRGSFHGGVHMCTGRTGVPS